MSELVDLYHVYQCFPTGAISPHLVSGEGVLMSGDLVLGDRGW